MQAMILAAGMGRRLKKLTQNNTKCMVKVNGVTLIERMLRQIEQHDISRIVIVIGYEGQKLMDYIGTLSIKTPIVYVTNEIYDKTNNIYSLALAQEYLCEEDTLLFESDLIFEDSVLDELIRDPRETLALVDKYENGMDGTCLKLGKDDSIEEIVPGAKFKFEEMDEYYITVNIYKFSRDFSKNFYVPFLNAYRQALGHNDYYEMVLRVITLLDKTEIRAKRLEQQLWYEIDDAHDLDIASSIFMPDVERKVGLLQERYGGYWRYPKLIDFSYLSNPYFPPKKLIDEIKANFTNLLTQYPSGMRVNSLLAAKNFDVPEENILVGNGAADLIKVVIENLEGNLGIIRPTFEEYPNRYNEGKVIMFEPQTPDFSYSAEDVMKFFDDKDIKNLVLINPDNPSGNYIPRNNVLRLVEWAKRRGIRLVIDESFADFAEEKNNSLIDEEILLNNPHIFVIKSISQTCGISGIRLGIMASGSEESIAELKKNLAIWNINSFAEFYMQIEEKYKKEYALSLRLFKEERVRFENELKKITGINVISSQANYIMIEVLGKFSAKELTEVLLFNHDLFVKDLTSKFLGSRRQFIRVAVRNTNDNNKLIDALKWEMCCDDK